MPLCRGHRSWLHPLYKLQQRSFMKYIVHYKTQSPIFCPEYPSEGALQLPSAVTTLDPVRFTSANYFDISQSPLRIQFRRIQGKQINEAHPRQYGSHIHTSDTPFPPNTNGFLYLSSPPEQSPLAATLRFRLTESSDPRTFVHGHDLLMDHGVPWGLHILEVLRRGRFANLANVLADDGLAPPELKFVSQRFRVERDTVFIGALGDPWVIDWSWEYSRIIVTAPSGRPPVAALIKLPWYFRSRAFSAPYSGRGIVSIVKTPDGELGLRIEKILRLQQYTTTHNLNPPLEGQVVALRTRPILKTTKMSEEKMDQLFHFVTNELRLLPWRSASPDPLRLYRHKGLPMQDLRYLGLVDDLTAALTYEGTSDKASKRKFSDRQRFEALSI